jgi:hypothetical protein
MKKLFFILSLSLATTVRLFAQQDDDNEGGEKIRDKMNEYIQKRLDLSKDEAEKFTPLFLRYFKEWRQAVRENKGDKLIMQQKIIELRLRYRTQFRDIIGERRSNQVFGHQERFIQEIRGIRQERLGNNPRPFKRRG